MCVRMRVSISFGALSKKSFKFEAPKASSKSNLDGDDVAYLLSEVLLHHPYDGNIPPYVLSIELRMVPSFMLKYRSVLCQLYCPPASRKADSHTDTYAAFYR